MRDPLLPIEAERMRELLDSPQWVVLRKYVESARDEALQHLLDPRQDDQLAHHWRGVHTGCLRVLGFPAEIIAYEKAQRSRESHQPPAR